MTTPTAIDRDEYLSAVRHDRGPLTNDVDPDDYAGSLDGLTNPHPIPDCCWASVGLKCDAHRRTA